MSIIKKENNKYTIRYRDENGKQREKTIRGSKTAAERMQHKILADVDNLKRVPEMKKKKVLFSEIAEKYWNLHGKNTKSADRLIYSYNIVLDTFKKKKVSEIKTEDIQNFYNKKLSETSPSTANRYFTLIRAIFNHAEKLDLYNGKNPCNGVNRKRDNPPRECFLTKEQIKALLLTDKREKIMPIIKFAIMTGMRRGEILNLDWKDIDLESNIIYIHKSKSGKPRRIPIISSLREELLKLNPKKEGKVFSITIPSFKYQVRHLLNELELEAFRFHDLRHTFASLFEEETSDIYSLKDILGHSTLALTARYAHLSPKYQSKVINSLNPYFDEILEKKE